MKWGTTSWTYSIILATASLIKPLYRGIFPIFKIWPFENQNLHLRVFFQKISSQMNFIAHLFTLFWCKTFYIWKKNPFIWGLYRDCWIGGLKAVLTSPNLLISHRKTKGLGDVITFSPTIQQSLPGPNHNKVKQQNVLSLNARHLNTCITFSICGLTLFWNLSCITSFMYSSLFFCVTGMLLPPGISSVVTNSPNMSFSLMHVRFRQVGSLSWIHTKEL